MCTLLFANQYHSTYDFIFLGNRDELKNRPSQGAHFWREYPQVLAGVDLDKDGTWTGMTKNGRFAFITNYRDPSLQKETTLSRGFITRDFLINSISPFPFLQKLQSQRKSFNPFNVVVGTINECWFYSNVENQIRKIEPGIHGLSNALLNTPWFKVNKGKERLAQLIHTDFTVDDLFDILDDTEVPLDKDLPRTGVPIETERVLSTIHIDTSQYGTMFKTIILVTKNREVQFYEKMLTENNQWKLSSYTFNLSSETNE